MCLNLLVYILLLFTLRSFISPELITESEKGSLRTVYVRLYIQHQPKFSKRDSKKWEAKLEDATRAAYYLCFINSDQHVCLYIKKLG